MWSWTRDFLKKHKRKFLTAGIVAGGVYALGKVLQWKLAEINLKEAKEFARQAKKQFHYENNQKTCATTFENFMVILRDKIIQSLDTEQIVSLIGKHPENKLELWEELKTVSVTKAITSVIAACCLYLFIKVQMNIIAGYMFLESMEGQDEDELADVTSITRDIEIDYPYSSIQKEYLSNVRVFFEEGINLLIQDTKNIVSEIIGSLPLTSKLDHFELSKTIFRIWEQLQAIVMKRSVQQTANSSFGFSRFLLNHEECQAKTVYFDEEKYHKIMSETLDVIESEDFNAVLLKCINDCLEKMMINMEQFFHGDNDTSQSLIKDQQTGRTALPLAKIIPLLSAQMNQVFKSGQNDYTEYLFTNELINTFSANIYESFSEETE